MAKALEVLIKGNADHLRRELASAGTGASGLGAKFMQGARVAAAAGVAITAAAVGAGLAAYKIGSEFDSAYDTIRIGTGATGRDLGVLKDDFRAVVQNVPTDFGRAGSAIADLNTGLGLTGKPLQDVSARMLELNRMLGGDLPTQTRGAIRVFGDWGVSQDEMTGKLDALFRTSQATGIGFDQLTAKMVQYGAPLRQVGFTFEEAAAMVGQFEKEGVNAELVMGSIRQALGKMAREGEPAVETFKRVSGEIKNAGSASEANLIALELFGARAGPDMAAAIREGRFEIGDLVDTISNGGETILGASAATMDFAERWQMFKNQVLVGIEPLATRVFEAIGNFAAEHGPKVAAFITNTLVPAVEKLGTWLGKVGDEYGPKVSAFFTGTLIPAVQSVAAWVTTNLVPAIQALVAAATAFWQDNGPALVSAFQTAATVAGTVATVITRVVTTFATLIANSGALRAIIATVLAGFLAYHAVVGVMSAVKAVQVAVKTAQVALNVAMAANPIGIVIAVLAALVAGLVYAYNNCETFRNFVDRAWQTILGFGRAIASFVSGAVAALGRFFSNIGRTFSDFVAKVRAIPGQILDAFRNAPTLLLNAGRNVITGLINGVGAMASALREKALSVIRGAIDRVKGWLGIGSPSRLMLSMGKDVISGMINGIGAMVGKLKEKALGVVRDAIDRVKGWVPNVVKRIGTSMISGMVNGIGSMATALKDKALGIVKGAVDRVKNFLGISSPSRLMTKMGRSTMEGFVGGVSALRARAQEAMRRVVTPPDTPALRTPALRLAGIEVPGVTAARRRGLSSFGAGLVPAAAGGPRTMTVVVELDGRTIARASGPYIAEEVRVKTGVRF